MNKHFLVFVVMVGFVIIGNADVSNKNLPDEVRFHNFQLQTNVSEKLLKSLEHKDSKEYKRNSLAAAEKLVKENKNDEVYSRFIYAKTNWMLGEYSSAIDSLNQIIKQNPQYETKAYKAPASVTARFWLAAIFKETRQIAKAKEKYLEIIKQIETEKIDRCRVLAIFAYFYLSEIAEQEKDTKQSVRFLKKIINIPLSPDVPQYINTLLSNLAEFNISRLSRGLEAAQKTLMRKTSDGPYILAAIMFKMQGIVGGEGVFFNGAYDNSILMFYQPLETVRVKSFSNIDKVFADILLGTEYLKHHNYARAIKYFQTVYESDSFFAPEAGILQINCFLKEGKHGDQKTIFDELKRRFPSYISMPAKRK